MSSRDDTAWAYNSDKEANLVASTAVLEPATDAMTGMLVSNPAIVSAKRANGAATAGYSPELSKALKSVVKIFTTMAK